jgi:periplasmic divalent cation tolerance protein
MVCFACTAYYTGYFFLQHAIRGRELFKTGKNSEKGRESIMTEHVQVLTTVEHKADAEKIAKILVEKHLAACVQIIGPLTSYFTWEGKLDTAQEYLCLIKSRDDLFAELEETIKTNHPYEVPEILATPITKGGKDYLNWMAAALKA